MGTCPCAGATCEDVLAPCAGGPCKNGGECRESEDYKRFSCSCPPGWQGEPALPAGPRAQQLALVLLPVSPQLIWSPCCCPAGQTCEIDINECVKSPCRNGATCQNTNGSYRCLCRVGFAGRNCDTDIDDCQPSKSQGHPGLCVFLSSPGLGQPPRAQKAVSLCGSRLAGLWERLSPIPVGLRQCRPGGGWQEGGWGGR